MAWGRLSGRGIAVALGLMLAASLAHAQSVGVIGARSNGDQARALMARGLEQVAQGARSEALVDFTAALSLHAFSGMDLARALFDRGVTLDGMGRLNNAIGDYSAAINLAPNFPAALNNRANAWRRLGRLDEARRDYLASLAAGNPTPEYSYYGLGQIAEIQGDRQAARAAYARALWANPRYVLAGHRLAVLSPPGSSPLVILKPPAAAVPAVPRLALRAPASHPTITPATYDRPDAGAALRPAIEEGTAVGPLIQLGAWRDEASAADGWNHARARAGAVLAGLTPHIVAVDLPGRGRYFRLRAGPVAGSSPAKVCAALTADGLACIVVR